jgi:DNA-binding NarL/FixJ family response regulator
MTAADVRDRHHPISLVLIEDNRLLRQGIVALIREQSDLTVVAAPASVGRALKKVREARPRVVLLDCGLVGYDSLDLTATVHGAVPEARIVGMGLLPFQEEVTDFLGAGASGFIMKDAPLGDVLRTIRTVARGVDVIPPQLTLSIVSRLALEAAPGGRSRMLEAVRLTGLERRVIALEGNGHSNREIASRLHLPLHAVKSHMQNLLEKLALRTRLEPDASVSPAITPPGVVLQV